MSKAIVTERRTIEVRALDRITGNVIPLGRRTLGTGGVVVETGMTFDREWITMTRPGHRPVIVSVASVLCAMAEVQAMNPELKPAKLKGGRG